MCIGFRGKAAHVIFFDEAEAANGPLRKVGIAPTMSMEDSCIICFSSATAKDNSWMQRFIHDPKYKDRNSVVKALHISRLCERCSQADPPPSYCPHAVTPPQQDPRREEFVKDFMFDPGELDACSCTL
jgi:hypothetical protein